MLKINHEIISVQLKKVIKADTEVRTVLTKGS